MNKAFIFDMDGVIIDTEAEWKKFDAPYFSRILSEDILEKIGDITGLSIKAVSEKAAVLGATIDEKRYIQDSNETAAYIYGSAVITEGLSELTDILLARDFRLGLVSASPEASIDIVLARLPFRDKLNIVLSVNDHPSLRQKPHPDAYIETLKELGVEAEKSIILEDSNPGIAAAKGSGAYTIGFKSNLPHGYEQTGADAYADTMDDVIKLVESFDGN